MRFVINNFHKINKISVTLSAWTGGTATFTPATGTSYTLSALPIGTEIWYSSWLYKLWFDNKQVWTIDIAIAPWYNEDWLYLSRSWTSTKISTTPIALETWDSLIAQFSPDNTITLVCDDWYFYDYGTGEKITEILDNQWWRIVSYWYDSWQAYAAMFIATPMPYNIYYYFDTSNLLFKWFYIDWVYLTPRQEVQLSSWAHTIEAIAEHPVWSLKSISWWQSIAQQIMQWQTCLSNDNVNSYNYLVMNDKYGILLWLSFCSSRDPSTSSVTEYYMPFISDWYNILTYQCYTDNSVLSDTGHIWADLERQWNGRDNLAHMVSNLWFASTDDYFDYVLSLVTY